MSPPFINLAECTWDSKSIDFTGGGDPVSNRRVFQKAIDDAISQKRLLFIPPGKIVIDVDTDTGSDKEPLYGDPPNSGKYKYPPGYPKACAWTSPTRMALYIWGDLTIRGSGPEHSIIQVGAGLESFVSDAGPPVILAADAPGGDLRVFKVAMDQDSKDPRQIIDIRKGVCSLRLRMEGLTIEGPASQIYRVGKGGTWTLDAGSEKGGWTESAEVKSGQIIVYVTFTRDDGGASSLLPSEPGEIAAPSTSSFTVTWKGKSATFQRVAGSWTDWTFSVSDTPDTLHTITLSDSSPIGSYLVFSALAHPHNNYLNEADVPANDCSYGVAGHWRLRDVHVRGMFTTAINYEAGAGLLEMIDCDISAYISSIAAWEFLTLKDDRQAKRIAMRRTRVAGFALDDYNALAAGGFANLLYIHPSIPMDFDRCTFESNQPGGSGIQHFGTYVKGAVNVTRFTNCAFEGSSSGYQTVAVDEILEIRGCLFLDCFHAIRVQSKTTIVDCIFDRCAMGVEKEGSGPGDNLVRIVGCSFINIADGGAIYTGGTGRAWYVAGCRFIKTSYPTGGSIISHQSLGDGQSMMTVVDCDFSWGIRPHVRVPPSGTVIEAGNRMMIRGSTFSGLVTALTVTAGSKDNVQLCLEECDFAGLAAAGTPILNDNSDPNTRLILSGHGNVLRSLPKAFDQVMTFGKSATKSGSLLCRPGVYPGTIKANDGGYLILSYDYDVYQVVTNEKSPIKFITVGDTESLQACGAKIILIFNDDVVIETSILGSNIRLNVVPKKPISIWDIFKPSAKTFENGTCVTLACNSLAEYYRFEGGKWLSNNGWWYEVGGERMASEL